MFVSTLVAVRNRLRADPALLAYFAARYPGCVLSTLIGIRPDNSGETSIPMDRFPYLAVSPMTGDKPAGPHRDRSDQLSIMFGVNDDREQDGVCQGVVAVCEIGELILKALEPQPIGDSPSVVWDGAARMVSDAGIFHPYYEGEIIITLKVRKP